MDRLRGPLAACRPIRSAQCASCPPCVPLMAAKRLPVPDRAIIVLGLAEISSYTGPMVRSVLMGTLDACLKDARTTRRGPTRSAGPAVGLTPRDHNKPR